jgi:signal transduction histidine kinase
MRVVMHDVERLHVQIEDLLAANQLRAGAMSLERTPLDLRQVVEHAVHEIQILVQAKRQPLEVALPDPMPVLGDARRLGQAVINLLANANRHTPAGTRITVIGEVEDDKVHLSVRDFGPGISVAEIDTIFERFRQYGPTSQGSGLGLGIARAVVEMHGGQVWVETPEDGGTEFHIALPRAEREEAE